MLPPMPTEFTQPPWWAELRDGRPVVHVTQGTVATETTELVLPTIQALANEEALLVVTAARKDGLGTLPDNVRLERMIPHALLLPHVDVMVTNGYNGVKAALAFGVPLVVAGASEDKPEVNSRVAWSGAGIDLKTGSPTPDQIKRAVKEVLQNPSYRQKARMIQSDFARHDSPTEAARCWNIVQTSPVIRVKPDHWKFRQ
jgi:UDP:flavonoid glycosyltransferase YjiC (YdhE family)